MADPLTLSIAIISIVSSAATFSSKTTEFTKRARRSDNEIEAQLYEIKVMCEVLEECRGIIEASRNTTIPASVDRTMDVCHHRFQELMELMERHRRGLLQSNSTFARMSRWTKQLASESERRSAFSAFRNAVMLLRDLCTDIRLRQQLVDMSAGFAELMVDYSVEQDRTNVQAPQPKHIYIGDGEEQPRAGELARTISTDFASPAKTHGTLGFAMKDLIRQNFTRNATIVVDKGTGTFPDRVQYVHVRAKMDTGCNDNLVTIDLIKKAAIDLSKLRAIPGDEEISLTGLDNAKCTPLYETDLTWYQDGDMKMRESRFYVVNQGPFDMLIGSRRFAQDLGSDDHPSLIIGRRRKEKAEREKDKAEHERYLRLQQDAERARRGLPVLTSGQTAHSAPGQQVPLTTPSSTTVSSTQQNPQPPANTLQQSSQQPIPASLQPTMPLTNPLPQQPAAPATGQVPPASTNTQTQSGP